MIEKFDFLFCAKTFDPLVSVEREKFAEKSVIFELHLMNISIIHNDIELKILS